MLASGYVYYFIYLPIALVRLNIQELIQWDIFSDLAMMALLKYFFASRVADQQSAASCGEKEEEEEQQSQYEMQQVVAMPLDTQNVVYIPMQFAPSTDSQAVYIAQHPQQRLL